MVQEQLKSLGEEPNTVLVLDNCSAHPDAKELVSEDERVIAKYLPPFNTANGPRRHSICKETIQEEIVTQAHYRRSFGYINSEFYQESEFENSCRFGS